MTAAELEILVQEKADQTGASGRPYRRAQLVATVFLLVTIGLPSVAQLITELVAGKPLQELDILRSVPTLSRIQAYEGALEDNSVVAKAVRPYVHWLQSALLRERNRKAIVGPDSTLWYRPSVDAAIAPGFLKDSDVEGSPLAAIVHFRDMLKRRGVRLVLCIVPGKEAIYPEWLSGRYDTRAGPAVNADMPAFLAALDRAGIETVNPSTALWRARREHQLYLRQDTHWTPQGMELVADALAQQVGPVEGPRRQLIARTDSVGNTGDLCAMLGLPAGLPTGYVPETVTIRRVLDAGGGIPYEPGPGARVVLLGDSFTNIYSDPSMGWGDHAGLGEHLALRLKRDVRIIALNDGGVNTARARLAREPGALDEVQVVIWQFAARDLVVSNGKWQIITIP